MNEKALEPFLERLDFDAADVAGFEAKFGKRASIFLSGLSGLFRLYRRLPYENRLPQALRHQAAAVALYISERQDFLPDNSINALGLIDDLWLAYTPLPQFAEALGEEALQSHWQPELQFSDVLALAENASELTQHVPFKVLERLQDYLGSV